ncbi:TPA: inositol 2-dehydrogenase [Candidatus Poribacteria bacterium]|nr:inositol 2-dehydrogenase [Candidatus Poribacteria bacterium]
MKKLGLGIIGAGSIGRVHIENLVERIPKAEVIGIADARANEIKNWAEKLGIDTVTQEPLELIHNPRVEAIVISSPGGTHPEFIIESAKAGKHVFCEKPIGYNLFEIKKALDEVQRAGIKLQVGFNRRFDRNFSKVHEFIETGKLGDIFTINIVSRDPEPPSVEAAKISGGIFMDTTIHDFDMARFLKGNNPVQVYTVGRCLINPKYCEIGDYDTVVSILTFEDGSICTIDNSLKSIYGYDQRVEVFGAKGGVIVFNERPTNAVIRDESGTHIDNPLFFFRERYKDSYLTEMENFISCILEDKEPMVTGLDGLWATVLAIASSKSANEKRPVKIAEIL